MQEQIDNTSLVALPEVQLGEPLSPRGEQGQSRLLLYLPNIYSEQPGPARFFLNGFMRIFESIWEPLDRQLDQLYAYFDPQLTPEEFLPWLGTWVDLVLDENWDVARQRELIRHAAKLYRRRGTAQALREYLTIYTGVEPQIIEDGDAAQPFHFTVLFCTPHPETLNQDRIRRIIEEEKPAHTIYTLQLEQVP